MFFDVAKDEFSEMPLSSMGGDLATMGYTKIHDQAPMTEKHQKVIGRIAII